MNRTLYLFLFLAGVLTGAAALFFFGPGTSPDPTNRSSQGNRVRAPDMIQMVEDRTDHTISYEPGDMEDLELVLPEERIPDQNWFEFLKNQLNAHGYLLKKTGPGDRNMYRVEERSSQPGPTRSTTVSVREGQVQIQPGEGPDVVISEGEQLSWDGNKIDPESIDYEPLNTESNTTSNGE